MSNQCKNCDRDRDLNNNYVGYSNGYMTNANNNTNNRNTTSIISNNNTNNTTSNNNSNSNSNAVMQGPKITAKVMFGSLGAIKELREKEHAEKTRSTQAGRRH